MGVFAWAARRIVSAAIKSAGWHQLFQEIYGGREAGTGNRVTWASALEVATVLACARVLAEGVAQAPWSVMQRLDNGQRRVAEEHPAHRLLHRAPNARSTAFAWVETMMFHAALTGNYYNLLVRVGNDRALHAIHLIEPQRVRVDLGSDGDPVNYRVRGHDGRTRDFAPEMVWHGRGPSWDSAMGLEATRLAREAIGLAMATEAAHATMHRSGTRTAGFYSVTDALSLQKYNELAAWLDKYQPGGEREGKPMILDRGARFEQQQMTGVDAQHLETRRHQIEEICRAFRVMPLMVGHPADMAARAATESIFLMHVVHSLMPWYCRLEQAANMALLTEEERAAGYYTKMSANALMRGAAKDRGEFYAKALGAGGQTPWLEVNEVRAWEDLPPVAWGAGRPAFAGERAGGSDTAENGGEGDA